MPRPSLGSLLAWLGVLVSLVFTYVAARDVQLDRVWDALASSNQWFLLPSVAALVVAVFLRTARWRYVFQAESRPALRAVTEALLIGYLFNNILPARAGEAARVVALHQSTDASRLKTVGTITLERVYDVLTLLMLLFFAAPFLPEVTWLRRAAVLAVVLVIVVIAAVVILTLFGDRPVRFLLRPLERVPRISRARAEQAAANLVIGVAGIRNVKLAAGAFLLTTASWLALAVSAWALLFAFDLDLDPGFAFGAGLLVVVATNLAQVLPSSPGALGVFEAAAQLALGAFGIDESSALSYAILLHAVNFFPFVLVGYVVLHRHAGYVRRRPREAETGPET